MLPQEKVYIITMTVLVVAAAFMVYFDLKNTPKYTEEYTEPIKETIQPKRSECVLPACNPDAKG